MSAPHFFAASVDGDEVALTGEEAHHARRVLRIRAGELITVSDGRGSVVEAEVRELGGDAVRARITARRHVQAPRPRVVLFAAVPKAGKLEMAVQKATEIGVDEVRPWVAARTVARWDEGKAAAHVDRWRAVALEAAKQSRRAWLPSIADVGAPEPLPAVTLVLHETEGTRLHAALPADPPDVVGVVVGPEGGLTDEEVHRFEAGGASAAGLGEQVLRTETAMIVGCALVLARYGRLG